MREYRSSRPFFRLVEDAALRHPRKALRALKSFLTDIYSGRSNPRVDAIVDTRSVGLSDITSVPFPTRYAPPRLSSKMSNPCAFTPSFRKSYTARRTGADDGSTSKATRGTSNANAALTASSAFTLKGDALREKAA